MLLLLLLLLFTVASVSAAPVPAVCMVDHIDNTPSGEGAGGSHCTVHCFYCMAVTCEGKPLVCLIDEEEEEEKEEEELDHGIYTLRAPVMTV